MHPQGACPAFSCCLSAGGNLKSGSFPVRGCWWVLGASSTRSPPSIPHPQCPYCRPPQGWGVIPLQPRTEMWGLMWDWAPHLAWVGANLSAGFGGHTQPQ